METEVASQRKRILIADDNAIILKTLSFKLKSVGFEVLTAADGSEAVKSVRSQRPDLILLDISFPPDVSHGGGVAWDGFLIMDWIRRIDESQKIPVIIISGSAPEKFEKRAKDFGAVAYFQKPLDYSRLVATIQSTLTVAAPVNS